MSQLFSVNINKNKNITTINCNGDIDLTNIQTLQNTFTNINKEEKTILNLTNVSFIDSAGLGIIAKHAKLYKQSNNPLQVDCLENTIHKVFKLSNLDNHILVLNVVEGEYAKS